MAPHPPYENDEDDLLGQGGGPRDPFPETMTDAGELRGLYKLALSHADNAETVAKAVALAGEALDMLKRNSRLLSASERLLLFGLDNDLAELAG